MPSDLASSIRYLEETNNPADAYFSYTVDESGEYGLIKANKEGLRLYAAEILKKSQSLEEDATQRQDLPLFFSSQQWLYSDSGYDLIAGVLPQYQPRREILAAEAPIRSITRRSHKPPVLLFLLMCITGALIMLATLKAFPNLRLWVNIH
jgi:hypothetical protein